MKLMDAGPDAYQTAAHLSISQTDREIARLRQEVALWKDRYEAAEQALEATIADYERVFDLGRGR